MAKANKSITELITDVILDNRDLDIKRLEIRVTKFDALKDRDVTTSTKVDLLQSSNMSTCMPTKKRKQKSDPRKDTKVTKYPITFIASCDDDYNSTIDDIVLSLGRLSVVKKTVDTYILQDLINSDCVPFRKVFNYSLKLDELFKIMEEYNSGNNEYKELYDRFTANSIFTNETFTIGYHMYNRERKCKKAKCDIQFPELHKCVMPTDNTNDIYDDSKYCAKCMYLITCKLFYKYAQLDRFLRFYIKDTTVFDNLPDGIPKKVITVLLSKVNSKVVADDRPMTRCLYRRLLEILLRINTPSMDMFRIKFACNLKRQNPKYSTEFYESKDQIFDVCSYDRTPQMGAYSTYEVTKSYELKKDLVFEEICPLEENSSSDEDMESEDYTPVEELYFHNKAAVTAKLYVNPLETTVDIPVIKIYSSDDDVYCSDIPDSTSASEPDIHCLEDDISEPEKDLESNADQPPQEADQPPQEADQPPQEADKPPQEEDKPPQEEDKPPQEVDKPPQEEDKPPQEADKPPQEADKPPQEADQSMQEADQSMQEADQSMQEADQSMQEADQPVEIAADHTVQEIDQSIKEMDKTMQEVDKSMKDIDQTMKDIDNTAQTLQQSLQDLQTMQESLVTKRELAEKEDMQAELPIAIENIPIIDEANPRDEEERQFINTQKNSVYKSLTFEPEEVSVLSKKEKRNKNIQLARERENDLVIEEAFLLVGKCFMDKETYKQIVIDFHKNLYKKEIDIKKLHKSIMVPDVFTLYELDILTAIHLSIIKTIISQGEIDDVSFKSIIPDADMLEIKW